MSADVVINLDEQFIRDAEEICNAFKKLCHGREGVSEGLWEQMAIPDLVGAVNYLRDYTDLVGATDFRAFCASQHGVPMDEVRRNVGEEFRVYLELVRLQVDFFLLIRRYGIQLHGSEAPAYIYPAKWPWAESFVSSE